MHFVPTMHACCRCQYASDRHLPLVVRVPVDVDGRGPRHSIENRQRRSHPIRVLQHQTPKQL
jgi:hypothetical protein